MQKTVNSGDSCRDHLIIVLSRIIKTKINFVILEQERKTSNSNPLF